MEIRVGLHPAPHLADNGAWKGGGGGGGGAGGQGRGRGRGRGG